MSNWIYSKDGKEHGPMSTARVADDVLKGLLELDDYVLSVETQLWKKVREVQPIMDIVYKPMPNNLFEDVSRDQFSRFVQGEEDIFAEPIFFNMPWTRFIILQVLTVGTFQVYWFIRQWMYMTKSKSRGSFRIILFLFVAAFYIFSEIEHDRDLNKAYRQLDGHEDGVRLVPGDSLAGFWGPHQQPCPGCSAIPAGGNLQHFTGADPHPEIHQRMQREAQEAIVQTGSGLLFHHPDHDHYRNRAGETACLLVNRKHPVSGMTIHTNTGYRCYPACF